MKISSTRPPRQKGQILAEACIGLSLMVFVWIIITYSLYLANYQIRAEMAARYAAWYQGNSSGTAATAAQLDQYFFYQGGLSSLAFPQADGIVDALAGINNTNTSSSYNSGDGSGGNGPFKVQVTFGVSSLNNSTNPYPFSLVSSDLKIPFMPSSTFSLTAVNATCQWDGDSDTWNTWTSAGEGIWNSISSEAGGAGTFFSSLF